MTNTKSKENNYGAVTITITIIFFVLFFLISNYKYEILSKYSDNRNEMSEVADLVVNNAFKSGSYEVSLYKYKNNTLEGNCFSFLSEKYKKYNITEEDLEKDLREDKHFRSLVEEAIDNRDKLESIPKWQIGLSISCFALLVVTMILVAIDI